VRDHHGTNVMLCYMQKEIAVNTQFNYVLAHGCPGLFKAETGLPRGTRRLLRELFPCG
jgi:hypothetical protein